MIPENLDSFPLHQHSTFLCYYGISNPTLGRATECSKMAPMVTEKTFAY